MELFNIYKYTYEVVLENYNKEGNGCMKYHNGDVYKGIFVNNIKHGKGEMKNNKGDIFIGEWKNVIFKEGEINYINDDYYIGDYKINNERNIKI